MGQAGTGKTYTVHAAGRLGSATEGVAPRAPDAASRLTRGGNRRPAPAYELSLRLPDVVGEHVFDLLMPDGILIRGRG